RRPGAVLRLHRRSVRRPCGRGLAAGRVGDGGRALLCARRDTARARRAAGRGAGIEEAARMSRRRLGVNIDHVATVRNARGEGYPDPVRAAEMALAAGADGITAHLREDRRHISDADMDQLAATCRRRGRPLNYECAVTPEMEAIALAHKPHAACLVPERREEVTTEGGLDVVRGQNTIAPVVRRLAGAGIRVSAFIDADEAQVRAAKAVGAQVIELHTGAYCEAVRERRPQAEALLNSLR